MPVLKLEGVTKDYALGETTVRALRGLDLEVEKGEILAIMGPSGSGKSTLMHILGLLDTPTAGEASIEGTSVETLSERQLPGLRGQKIGFVFQTFNLLPRLSSLENVELPLLYAGRSEAQAAAEAALRTVGLGDRMYHEPNQLSGGQRQRVSIARAIVSNPDIVLADEPTGNLDSKTGVEIMALLKALHEQKRTIIIVTHDPDIAQHCSNELHMRDGQIVERRGT